MRKIASFFGSQKKNVYFPFKNKQIKTITEDFLILYFNEKTKHLPGSKYLSASSLKIKEFKMGTCNFKVVTLTSTLEETGSIKPHFFLFFNHGYHKENCFQHTFHTFLPLRGSRTTHWINSLCWEKKTLSFTCIGMVEHET